jgi:S-adenosyl-L-methionine hydrolase (adenosine-forming)
MIRRTCRAASRRNPLSGPLRIHRVNATELARLPSVLLCFYPLHMITLTTDFGTSDGYVAAMKGVMLSIHADARLVDVTHEIDPQDVMEAAFVLRTTTPFFPPGTVHLVVVDPGVGTDRRAVAVRSGDQWFVGPDNGVFPLVLDDKEPDEIRVLDNPDTWLSEAPSTTFHGRDIFAPVAAHLDAGRTPEDIGSPAEDLRPLRWAMPITDSHSVQGYVAHVDRFGNCITNIRRKTLVRTGLDDAPTHEYSAASPDPSATDAPGVDAGVAEPKISDLPALKAYVGNAVIENLHRTYGAVADGDPLLLFGSSGFLEVAVNAGSAAELLTIRKGDSIKVVFRRDAAE